MLSKLRQNIKSFVKYYNHLRYHETPGNVTPVDVYLRRKDDILVRVKKAKRFQACAPSALKVQILPFII